MRETGARLILETARQEIRASLVVGVQQAWQDLAALGWWGYLAEGRGAIVHVPQAARPSRVMKHPTELEYTGDQADLMGRIAIWSGSHPEAPAFWQEELRSALRSYDPANEVVLLFAGETGGCWVGTFRFLPSPPACYGAKRN